VTTPRSEYRWWIVVKNLFLLERLLTAVTSLICRIETGLAMSSPHSLDEKKLTECTK
jgi:hypothetical protein